MITLKLCGQKFWEFISGDDGIYTDIIEPLGHQAKDKNEQFMQEYAKESSTSLLLNSSGNIAMQKGTALGGNRQIQFSRYHLLKTNARRGSANPAYCSETFNYFLVKIRF